MAAGYDIGVNVPISSSAGAALSGAKELGGTTNFGTNFGPGSLILTTTDQSGSLGASSGGTSMWLLLGLAAIGVAAAWLLKKFFT